MLRQPCQAGLSQHLSQFNLPLRGFDVASVAPAVHPGTQKALEYRYRVGCDNAAHSPGHSQPQIYLVYEIRCSQVQQA